MAQGTVPYLLLMAAKSRVRGRKWIELNTAPARLLVTPILPLPLPAASLPPDAPGSA